jgi:hypothetical protein
MRFDHSLLLVALAAALPPAVNALFSDDVGVLDFAIATAGHGVVTTMVGVGGDNDDDDDDFSVVTSDAPGTSCFVASRKISDGSLNWRRNVCAVPSPEQRHAMAVGGSDDYFFTLDDTGIARAWTLADGALMWDAQVPTASSSPNLWTFSRSGKDYVAVASKEQLIILDATTGNHYDTIGLGNQSPKAGETAEWLAIVPDTGEGPVRAIFAFVRGETGVTAGNRMFLLEFQQGDDQIKSAKPLNQVRAPIVASSLQFQWVGDAVHAMALTTDSGGAVHFSMDSNLGNEIAASSWNSQWSTIESVAPTSASSIIAVQGSSEEAASSSPSMSLYKFDGSSWGRTAHGDGEAPFSAVSYCPAAGMVVAMGPTGPQLYRWAGTPLTVTGDMFVPDGDVISSFQVLECSSESITTLLSTARGTTTALSFQVSGDAATANILWTSEEGLASVSSAVLLDASHLGVDDMVEEQDVVMQKLSLPSRMASQWQSIVSLLSGGGVEFSRRDHIFGFMKVAATISQKSHRMWGMDTSGEDRGSIRWSVDLPTDAVWHTMVHGTTNSANSLHGINGGTHSREILVLSPSQSSVDWKCVDGTNGAIHAQGAIDIPSPVLQVIPIYGSSGGCRQTSILLHEDLSLTVTPNDPETVSLVQQQIKAATNGLFTHVVDKATSAMQAFHISESPSSPGTFVTTQVGRTHFADENIVKVSYPIRDEVVQSMCTVLGDDSLLLKYINPHMAVVITMSQNEDSVPTDLVASIEKNAQKPRKPAGAGDAATAEATPTSVPNMFVNLVDTVSGRVLHRASHYNVDPASNVAAVVSENWVLYSFINSKTRRTELGVLTLHEGMIESKGITMFSSAEQALSFSSLDARSSKPVVLAKTYTFPKTITALGTTATRGGISSRKILVASIDGKITSIDRSMLETRRPVGEVKEAEKKEGLFP